MRTAPLLAAGTALVLSALTTGHIVLNFGGLAAFAQRLSVGASARGEVIVGHLPVT